MSLHPTYFGGTSAGTPFSKYLGLALEDIHLRHISGSVKTGVTAYYLEQ